MKVHVVVCDRWSHDRSGGYSAKAVDSVWSSKADAKKHIKKKKTATWTISPALIETLTVRKKQKK